MPSRRSNAACCIADDGFLYVHGGHDLKEGRMSDLWRVSLDDALNNKAKWENLTNEVSNGHHYSLSHHVAVCYRQKIYFFGGSRVYKPPPTKIGSKKLLDNHFIKSKNDAQHVAYILDYQRGRWEAGPAIEKQRDDFAWAWDKQEGKLFLFGGFVEGEKANDLVCYDVKEGLVKVIFPELPSSRASSARSSSSHI